MTSMIATRGWYGNAAIATATRADDGSVSWSCGDCPETDEETSASFCMICLSPAEHYARQFNLPENTSLPCASQLPAVQSLRFARCWVKRLPSWLGRARAYHRPIWRCD